MHSVPPLVVAVRKQNDEWRNAQQVDSKEVLKQYRWGALTFFSSILTAFKAEIVRQEH